MKKIILVSAFLTLLLGTLNANTGIGIVYDKYVENSKKSVFEENALLLKNFKKKLDKESLRLLPTKAEAESLLKINFKNLVSRGDCPNGWAQVRIGNFDQTIPEDINIENTGGTERKKEMYQFAYSDGECAYVIHVVYDTGFLGLFPTDPYACMELVGCL